MTLNLKNILALAGAIAALIISGLLVKYAGESNTTFGYLCFFVPALIAGIINPACLTVALKDNEPNVVYAMFGGIGLPLLFMTYGIVFGDPFTLWHWVAVGINVFGAVLLQMKPKVTIDENDGSEESSKQIGDSDNPYHSPDTV